ncbi:MAG: hypothetical protein VKK59_06285 [Vampirovibrionales bacterium]|nr:hypothetical protein [Vampirovibrionales bacterium]
MPKSGFIAVCVALLLCGSLSLSSGLLTGVCSAKAMNSLKTSEDSNAGQSVTINRFELLTNKADLLQVKLYTQGGPVHYQTYLENQGMVIRLPKARLSAAQVDSGYPVVLDHSHRYVGRALPDSKTGGVKILLPNVPADIGLVRVSQVNTPHATSSSLRLTSKKGASRPQKKTSALPASSKAFSASPHRAAGYQTKTHKTGADTKSADGISLMSLLDINTDITLLKQMIRWSLLLVVFLGLGLLGGLMVFTVLGWIIQSMSPDRLIAMARQQRWPLKRCSITRFSMLHTLAAMCNALKNASLSSRMDTRFNSLKGILLRQQNMVAKHCASLQQGRQDGSKIALAHTSVLVNNTLPLSYHKKVVLKSVVKKLRAVRFQADASI